VKKLLLALAVLVTLSASAAIGPEIAAKYGRIDSVGRVAIPRVICQSAVSISAPADTTEDILATCTVPANALGINGSLRIQAFASNNNNANNKIFRIRFGGIGGTIVSAATDSTQIAMYLDCKTQNRGATNSQLTTGREIFADSAIAAGVQKNTAAVDTTASTTIVFTGQKAVAGDTITLESFLVELISDN
jgi:hypothetical protein